MRYLTVSQAAEALQLSVPTVKRYIYDGKLQSTKLPGGQHRIAESEVERLLRPDEARPEGGVPTAEATPEERLAVLERWATELEAEIERLSASLSVISRYCSSMCEEQAEAVDVPQAGPHSRVQVLGPGCRRCNELHALAVEVLQEMGRSDVQIEHTRDLAAIAAFGPIVTPGLVVAGELVLTGRVPDKQALRELLTDHLK